MPGGCNASVTNDVPMNGQATLFDGVYAQCAAEQTPAGNVGGEIAAQAIIDLQTEAPRVARANRVVRSIRREPQYDNKYIPLNNEGTVVLHCMAELTNGYFNYRMIDTDSAKTIWLGKDALLKLRKELNELNIQ